MKIEANDKQVSDIFSLGYFKIPRFQRQYSWEIEEVINFWEDVVVENHEHYFIGSMVVFDIKKPFLGIVDGQQRLTTITLMLASIRNAFSSLGEVNLAKGVHNYIEKANIDNENIYILDSETSFPYMQSHIQNFSPTADKEKVGNVGTEELALKNSFEIINSKLQDIITIPKDGQNDLFGVQENINTLKKIRDKVLSLKLVFIQLDNEEDAYLIFETLNTRGRDLTTPDLVKNMLFKKLKNNQEKFDSPKLIWGEIVQTFDDYDLDSGMKDFLYHYWISKYKYSTETKLFSEISKFISSEDIARSLLDDLRMNSDYYISVRSPENFEWTKQEVKIKDSLIALNLFRNKKQIPMAFSLCRAYREDKITMKEFSIVLSMMESFHFVFNGICSQRSSGSIHKFYSRHAISLANARTHAEVQVVFNDLKKSLLNKMPSYNEFEVGFKKLVYFNKNTRKKSLIKYILARFMTSQPTGVSIDINTMTLEHLIPQSSSNSTQDKYIGLIGNIILVDSKTNCEDLNNIDFIKKKEILLSKNYPLENYISESEVWNPTTIEERTKLLCKEAYQSFWAI